MLDPVWFNHEVLNEVDQNNYIEGVLLPHWKEVDPWFPEPFEDVLHVPYPVAIDPPHIARRVSVQWSRFTVHGKSKRGLEALANALAKPRLVKFVIPNAVGKQILSDLSTCGVMGTSVFPDLEGLSRELETKWTQLGFAMSSKPRKPRARKLLRKPNEMAVRIETSGALPWGVCFFGAVLSAEISAHHFSGPHLYTSLLGGVFLGESPPTGIHPRGMLRGLSVSC
jgi:hypothetical protein